MHKLHVYGPSEILIPSTAADPKSKLFSIVEDGLYDLRGTITLVDRRYWAETTGLEYLQQLALPDDAEALKIAASGQYFAVCCFAAVGHISLQLCSVISNTSCVGTQVCRACSGQDVSVSLAPYQVRAL